MDFLVPGISHNEGFGQTVRFSGTDVNTQQSFEQLNPRAVGVVVDPIQSVKGKVPGSADIAMFTCDDEV